MTTVLIIVALMLVGSAIWGGGAAVNELRTRAGIAAVRRHPNVCLNSFGDISGPGADVRKGSGH
jgi:hypothetical protein